MYIIESEDDAKTRSINCRFRCPKKIFSPSQPLASQPSDSQKKFNEKTKLQHKADNVSIMHKFFYIHSLFQVVCHNFIKFGSLSS